MLWKPIQDITVRKQTEEEIIAHDAKQRAMIANIADVISILNQSGIIIDVSPNIEKIVRVFYRMKF